VCKIKFIFAGIEPVRQGEIAAVVIYNVLAYDDNTFYTFVILLLYRSEGKGIQYKYIMK